MQNKNCSQQIGCSSSNSNPAHKLTRMLASKNVLSFCAPQGHAGAPEDKSVPVHLGTREGVAPEPQRAAGTGVSNTRARSTPSLFGPMGPRARQASASSSVKWEHHPPRWSTGQGWCSEHSRCTGNRCFSPHGPVELKGLWTAIACPSHTQGVGGPEPSCPPRPIRYWTPGSRAAFRGMKGSPASHGPCMEPRALFSEQLPR